MPSVVIPAHNEERVIGHALRSLLADAVHGEFDVVVACNGCTDRTAEVAAASHPDVRVVNTVRRGKATALNLGDEEAQGFPRVYMDADILMTTDALRATVAVLGAGALAAAPRLEYDPGDRPPWRVRQYFEIWHRTSYVSDGLIGSGVYGLSEAGRARFDAFPDIIADDLFVYAQFTDAERRTVRSHSFVVTPPRTLRGIIDVKTRVFAGNLQFRALYGDVGHSPTGHQLPAVLRRLPPRLWPAATIYAVVQLAAKAAAHRRVRRGDLRTWNRDDTSRSAVAARR